MQTKLRITGMMVAAFVAGLLWTSALAAAPAPQTATLAQAVKRVFGSKPRYVGVASWYGKQHQGKKMANGKPFDRRKMTAAAWNIPLGTVVRVVNLKNGKSVQVTITDRGPHPRLSRAIDLSEAAAIELDYIHSGLTEVFIAVAPKSQLESAPITAQLIEPLLDAPVFAEEEAAKPEVVSAGLTVPDQSR